MFGTWRFTVKFQVSSPSKELKGHILEIWVLYGVFSCDSALRVISQKLHHEVDTSITDMRKLLTELRWLRRG